MGKLNRPKIYGVIYRIENKINSKTYIGQTKYDFKKRLAQHAQGGTTYIQKAIAKHRLESFMCSVVDHAYSKKELNEKEKLWIKALHCKAPKGYNLTDGGYGGPPSQETRNKIGIANKGKTTGNKDSQETIRKKSAAAKNKPKSEQHKLNMRKPKPEGFKETMRIVALKRDSPSKESKEKNRQSHLGRIPTLEQRANEKLGIQKAQSEGKPFGCPKGNIPWNKGLTMETDNRIKPHTEEWKAANSERVTNRYLNKRLEAIQNNEVKNNAI